MDTRLRPSGQQGTLVSSLAGFRAYHARQALLWERQALIKLRTVAGDRALGETVEREAAQHIWSSAPGPDMAEEIGRLRARMEKELGRETAHRFNIKSGRGGLLDVEFLVQYLQLREGPARPSLRVRATSQALAALRDEGILAPDLAASLADSYAFLRRLENRLRIVNDRSIQEISDRRATSTSWRAGSATTASRRARACSPTTAATPSACAPSMFDISSGSRCKSDSPTCGRNRGA